LLGVMAFADRFRGTQFEYGLAARFRWRHSSAKMFLCLQCEMLGHLFP
jgi:hypothetical protein